MTRQPSFAVSTAVVVVLSVAAFFAAALKPLIPEAAPVRASTLPGEYVRAGQQLDIDWLPIGPDAFSEARRLDRPVLLVLGTVASKTGRDLDEFVFKAPEVQNYLGRNFICVRIDIDLMPSWRSAYLPLSRIPLGVRPDSQLWVLEPTGELIAFLGRRQAGQRFERGGFLRELIRIRKEFAELRAEGKHSALEIRNGEDRAVLEADVPSPIDDWAGFDSVLQNSIDPEFGGMPSHGYQRPLPDVWRYLAAAGQAVTLRQSLMPCLRSSVIDVLDGGVFRSAQSRGWIGVETDKSAIQIAEVAAALAVVHSSGLLSDEDSRTANAALEGCIRSLRGEFMADRGFVRAHRVADEDEVGRSRRASFSPRELRELLSAQERELVRNALGLEVEHNPQMLPRLAGHRAAAPDARLNTILSKLRARPSNLQFGGGYLMEVNGIVAARLIEVGRLAGHPVALSTGLELFERLEPYRSEASVPRDLEEIGRAPATLSDALAYSDAAFQYFLATGRVVSLQDGKKVLERALERFRGPTSGLFSLGLPFGSNLMPQTAIGPEVIDIDGESASSTLMRLCFSYGSLLSSSNGESTIDLMAEAYAIKGRFERLAPAVGPPMASFASAARQVEDGTFAITTGPNALELSNALTRLRPAVLVAPRVGPVRVDLSLAGPGVHIVRRGRASGPMSVSQAAADLATSFLTSEGP